MTWRLDIDPVEHEPFDAVPHRQPVALLIDVERWRLVDEEVLRLGVDLHPLRFVWFGGAFFKQRVELGIGVVPPVVPGRSLRSRGKEREHKVEWSTQGRPPDEPKGMVGGFRIR